MTAVLIITLLATLFLFPAALLLLLLLYFSLVAGEAALALIVGHTLFEAVNNYIYARSYKRATPLRPFLKAKGFKLAPNQTVCVLIGAVIIEGLRYTPFIGWGFSYIFFPIFALGTVYTAFINAFFQKRFYEPIF
jgi:hypothetical protein